jgi:hypothetical protein
MNPTAVVPELQNFGTCNACGRRIGWVRVARTSRRRPVDPDPRPNAEYALLRDGATVINLRATDVDLDLADSYEGPCFWDHAKTCPTPGTVTTRAILEAEGGYRNFYDPEKERARARLRAAGRSPWVKRHPGR